MTPHVQPHGIDPTGTYILKGDTKNNLVINSSGEIRIKLLVDGRVAFCLYVTAGYPAETSVSLLDTVVYDDNTVRYNPSGDAGCTLVFSFSPHAVELSETYGDEHGCSFGRGALVPAVFDKYSSQVPIIKDLSGRSR